VLVAVTDHAIERYRQRIAGSLDPRTEIASRVARAVEAGRVEEHERATVHVRDVTDRSLIFVCRRGDNELVVVTLWEHEGGVAPPRVPRRYTDALRRRR
jgi:hypothetical protein